LTSPKALDRLLADIKAAGKSTQTDRNEQERAKQLPDTKKKPLGGGH
jgi:hypothetical protein